MSRHRLTFCALVPCGVRRAAACEARLQVGAVNTHRITRDQAYSLAKERCARSATTRKTPAARAYEHHPNISPPFVNLFLAVPARAAVRQPTTLPDRPLTLGTAVRSHAPSTQPPCR